MSPHRFLITYCTITISFLFIRCSSEQNDKRTKPEYANHVEITVTLCASGNLTDFDREDIVFSIKNNGDKSITKLLGEVIFHDSCGEEVGRTGWLFINVNKELERMAVGEKKLKHQPLLSGQTLEIGADVLYLFGGEPELRQIVYPQWDDLGAQAVIREVVTGKVPELNR